MYRKPTPRVRVAGAGSVFLLWWGRHDQHGWVAAVAWLEGPPLNCLVTAWVAAANVRQESGERYDQVPRIPLAGEPDTWPAPPTEWGGGPYPGLHCHWLWVPPGERVPNFGAWPPGGPVTDQAR
jgi:hypothetical protein